MDTECDEQAEKTAEQLIYLQYVENLGIGMAYPGDQLREGNQKLIRRESVHDSLHQLENTLIHVNV